MGKRKLLNNSTFIISASSAVFDSLHKKHRHLSDGFDAKRTVVHLKTEINNLHLKLAFSIYDRRAH